MISAWGQGPLWHGCHSQESSIPTMVSETSLPWRNLWSGGLDLETDGPRQLWQESSEVIRDSFGSLWQHSWVLHKQRLLKVGCCHSQIVLIMLSIWNLWKLWTYFSWVESWCRLDNIYFVYPSMNIYGIYWVHLHISHYYVARYSLCLKKEVWFIAVGSDMRIICDQQ